MASVAERAPDTARAALDPAEESALLDSIQKWIDKELRPVVLHHDHNDIWPAAIAPFAPACRNVRPRTP